MGGFLHTQKQSPMRRSSDVAESPSLQGELQHMNDSKHSDSCHEAFSRNFHVSSALHTLAMSHLSLLLLSKENRDSKSTKTHNFMRKVFLLKWKCKMEWNTAKITRQKRVTIAWKIAHHFLSFPQKSPKIHEWSPFLHLYFFSYPKCK